MSSAKAVRRYLREIEEKAALVDELRATMKNEHGKMEPAGKSFLAVGKNNGIQQAFMAKLLDITAGAVSQHYSK